MNALPSVCILAGGRGMRLGEFVDQIPKPLLEVAGEPFLFHQLRLLAANGATHAILCVGYLGEQIEEHVGEEQFGIRVDYSYDTPGLDGTLGAIRRALPLLPDRFLVLYGDTYLRLDYRAADRDWRDSRCLGLMTVFHNDGRWDRSNVEFEDGRVLRYDKTAPTEQMRWIDYGLGGLQASALRLVGEDERELASLYRLLAERGELCGYEARERFYEIGSPDGLAETESFLSSL
jgi:N-acetyl-alpha-D-muramate 1-phosphate uridylyltransferase